DPLPFAFEPRLVFSQPVLIGTDPDLLQKLHRGAQDIRGQDIEAHMQSSLTPQRILQALPKCPFPRAAAIGQDKAVKTGSSDTTRAFGKVRQSGCCSVVPHATAPEAAVASDRDLNGKTNSRQFSCERACADWHPDGFYRLSSDHRRGEAPDFARPAQQEYDGRNDRQDPWHSRALSQAFSVLARFSRAAAGDEREVPKHALYREILH